jgi:hypothetical protein
MEVFGMAKKRHHMTKHEFKRYEQQHKHGSHTESDNPKVFLKSRQAGEPIGKQAYRVVVGHSSQFLEEDEWEDDGA